MKPGLKALAILLLFAGLVLVNYLAAHLPLRLDATAGKIYTLTPGTRTILGKIGEPLTLDFYFSRDVEGMPIQYKNYAEHVLEMLHQYVRTAGGRLILNVINPRADTPEEEKATAAGLKSVNDPASGAEPAYFGLVATQADQSAAIPGFGLQREQLLEYDLSQLIFTVQHQQETKKKIGLITSLPLLGSSPQDIQMMMMLQQQPKPGQYVTTEWAKNFNLVTVADSAELLPEHLDGLAIIHPQALSLKLLYAIDQFMLSGKPVFIAVDPSSQYFLRQADQQMMMMGAPQPKVSSDLPLLFKAYGIGYTPENVTADISHATKVQTSRSGAVSSIPTWLSLDHESVNPASPVTAPLNSFLFVEAGSFIATASPGVNLTPLLETSAQSGDLSSAALQLNQPDQMARNLKVSGKKTLAILLQGKFKTAFPDGIPKDEKPEEKKDSVTAPAATPLTESAASGSTMLLVADTDWLFDQYIFDPNYLQAGLLSPRNDNLDLAANVLDFLTGSPELLSVRGKGASLRPFTVVQQMESEARKKFEVQLTTLESRLTEVQTKLNGLQAKRTDGGRLVATPEMQAEILGFQKDEAAIRHEQRDIRRTLREDVDALGRRLLWINLLTTPLLVGLFGLWFSRARRQA